MVRVPALTALVPLACGLLAFAILGVPEAHASAAPSLSAEIVHLATDSIGALGQIVCEQGDGLDALLWGSGGSSFVPGTGSAATTIAGPRSPGLAMLGLGLLTVAAVVVLALGRMRLANENKRLDVAQRLIEQGMEPPASLLAGPARNDLRKGIVLLFAGGGVLAAGLLTGDRGMAAGALVPEFIGAGYLVSYWLSARTSVESS